MVNTLNHASRLVSTIDALYETFGRYRLEANFADRCSPLGDRPEIARRLTKKLLRETDLDDIAIYAFKAISTMGNERDFKHFLPRILEFLATSPEWFHHDTNVFNKLRELDWKNWPEHEQTAIEEFLRSLWQHILATYPWHQSALEVLNEFTAAMDDIEPFFHLWLHSSSVTAIRHLASAIKCAYMSSTSDEIKSRLLTEKIKAKLEEAFFEFKDEEFTVEISEAVDYFGRISSDTT